MKANVFFLSIFIIQANHHVRGRVLVEKREMIKPGQCRNMDDKSSGEECQDSCVYDSDCPGLTKCCRVGCGRRCVGGGFFLRLPTVSEEMSQLCPAEKMFAKRPCESRAVYCRSHADCDAKDGICCNDGCNTKCMPRGSLLTPDGLCRSTGWIFHPGELFQKSGCLLCVCYSAKRHRCHHLKSCGHDAEHQVTLLKDKVETETDSVLNGIDGPSKNGTNSYGVDFQENYVKLNFVLQSVENFANDTKILAELTTIVAPTNITNNTNHTTMNTTVITNVNPPKR